MPIDLVNFAKQCIRQAAFCVCSGHHLMGVAKLRSSIADDTQDGLVGPFRLTKAEWNANCADTQFGFDYTPADIKNWRAQCAVFALMTRRMQDKLHAGLGRNASPVELYLAQWPGTDATTLTAALKTALDDTAAFIQQAAIDVERDDDPASEVITDPDKQGPSGQQGGGTTAGTILRGDGSFNFTAEVVGDDIVVHNVRATWFGGPDDPSDNGQTASGVSTRDNPDIQGCALPMDNSGSSKTDGSPIPHLPWKTPVRVRNTQTGAERTFPLIDLGPSKSAQSHAAIDLTKAAFVALGGSPSAGVMRVDYVIPGAAHHLPPGSGSVSLGQSEATKPGSLPPQDANHGQSHDVLKPIVKFIKSPNFNSRNGTKIDMIVMHFTDGPSAQGAINRFLDRNEQVSAHYIIDRGGTIYQMVEDGDKAWHAKAANPRSIGIEHVAVAGQQMAPAQTTASVALVRWLMTSYGIKRSGIVGHRFAPGNEGTTDCPHHLFGNATKQAVVDWVNVHFPTEVS